MKILPLFLLLLLLLSACTPPTPAATDDPSAALLQTAAAKATEVASATRDPRLDATRPPKPTVTPSADWTLSWSEEFDGPAGSAPDPATWSYDIGGHGWGNNELEYYTDRIENAYLQDGKLVIEARKEEYEGRSYTSARLVTKGKAAWQYGRIEVRAMVPQGQGVWPAIWMLPDGDTYGGWPTGGEIDIMELLGHAPQKVYGTLHWGDPHASSGSSYTLQGDDSFAAGFHVFAIEWEPEEIRWYVDGYHFHTATQWMTSHPGAVFPAPFDQPFHLLVNVAVGGNWPGAPNAETQFPQRLVVDWVRVYTK